MPGARFSPDVQVVPEITKSLEFVPVTETELTVIAVVSWLVTVTFTAAVFVPTATAVKFTGLGEMPMPGTMVSVNGEDVLGAYVASPEYPAVIVWLPRASVEVVKLA